MALLNNAEKNSWRKKTLSQLFLLVGAHCFMEGDRVNFLETTQDNIWPCHKSSTRSLGTSAWVQSILCPKKNWRESSDLNMWNPGCPAYDFYEKKLRFSSHLGAKVSRWVPLEHSLVNLIFFLQPFVVCLPITRSSLCCVWWCWH